MKKLSLAASLLLITSSAAFAESTSIKEAFANGQASGDITAFYKTTDNDEGLTNGSLGLSYETDSINGFSAKASFRANHEFSEEQEGVSWDSEFENKALLTEAFIQYSNDSLTAIVGRQEIDLEWLGDYNEAAVLAFTAIPDTTVVLGYTNRQAASDETESTDFARVNGNDGAYVVDVKYSGVEGLELNPYYYTASKVADFYGMKATYESDILSAVAHYAASSEDAAGEENGSIYNLEVGTELSGLSLAAGYIKTDKKGDIGSMDALGDNIDPTEELGDSIYGKDAKTFYGTLGYSIAGVDLGLLYAQSKWDNGNASKDTDKEITLSADYSITEELSAGLVFTDLSMEDSTADNQVTQLTLSYAF